MEQVAQERGMSKGCLIALIVGGVVLVMCIAAAVTFYIYRDDAMRYATRTMVNGSKVELNKNSYGMDTVSVNRFFDAFATKIDSINLEDPAASQFFQTVSTVAGDGKVTEEESKRLMEAMAQLYPELRPLLPVSAVSDTTAMPLTETDSTAHIPVDSAAQPH